ncbi:rod shape-determining protein MreC [Bryobacter aggregatus]|uniref:rod shape-determining protein MreC n=1 Tax=Bryobacter aggregatus TaxID=360054 RepID=UPI0004E1808A|nr:rod shape-determining protein MreC [Bryobacter aggregatus]
MDGFLGRYRNLSVLVIVIMAQLVLLAVQVKNNQDVRLIRVWAVTAITPLARVLEGVRANTFGLAGEYWQLIRIRSQNSELKADLDRLKLENQFLKEELATAKRVEAMASFVQRNPNKTIGARIIGAGAGMNSKVVFIDRGSTAGVLKGMPVITPDGIVGKVTASYPTGSQVMLITDPTFACGVVSDKTRIHGTARGQGNNQLLVDYIQNEQLVEVGEIFFTSGDDRIFPKGLPVGPVRVARQGKLFKEIYVAPTAFEKGLEEVLVVLESVHQQIPDPAQMTNVGPEAKQLPPPPPDAAPHPVNGIAPQGSNQKFSTDADRILDRYKAIGEQQGLSYGNGGRVPNFNAPVAPRVAPKTAPTTPPGEEPVTVPPTQPQTPAPTVPPGEF